MWQLVETIYTEGHTAVPCNISGKLIQFHSTIESRPTLQCFVRQWSFTYEKTANGNS